MYELLVTVCLWLCQRRIRDNEALDDGNGPVHTQLPGLDPTPILALMDPARHGA